MFNEFDKIITSYQDDSIGGSALWYSTGRVTAMLYFNNFNDEDWQSVFKTLPNKSDEW